jgi:hypothetical protein
VETVGDLKVGDVFEVTSELNPSITERLEVLEVGEFVVKAASVDFVGTAYINSQRVVKKIQ